MVVLDRIKYLRKKSGISQKEMADRLNISQPGYQKIEQGTNVLSIERFLDICRILEISSYNQLLPSVNADTVEEISKVLLSGSMVLDNTQRNLKYESDQLSQLIESIKKDEVDKPKIIEQLEYIEDSFSLIRRNSKNEAFKLKSILDLLEKID